MDSAGTLVPDSYTQVLVSGVKAAKSRIQAYQDWNAGIYKLYFPERIAKELRDLGVRTNLCKPIVNALCSKLNLRTVSCVDTKLQSVLDTEYRHNQMQLQTTAIHSETAVNGDAYVLVWPEYTADHVATGRSFVRLLRSEDVDLIYDEEDLLRPMRCERIWTKSLPGGKTIVRRDILTPESVLRQYSARGEADAQWAPYTLDGLDSEVKNDLGEVPVVHFKIEEDLRNRPFGLSQLEPAIPICMDINVLVKDAMVRAYYNAGMQRVVTGVSKAQYDLDNPQGMDLSPWAVHCYPNPDAKEYTLKGDDIKGICDLIDKRVKHLAISTRTPLQYLEAGAQAVSGVALEKLDEQLKDRVDEAQTMMGAGYQRLFQLMLKAATGSKIEEDVTVEWERPYAVDTSSQDMDEYKAGLITAKQYHMRRGLDEKAAQKLVDELAAEQTTRTMGLFGGKNAG